MKKKHRSSIPRKRGDAFEPITTHEKGELALSRQPSDHGHPWIRHVFRCVALLLVVYVVYSNSFKSGWVLDNQFIIKLDPRIKQASLENLKLIWARDYWWPKQSTGAYRPVVSTTYWLNWSVLGNGRHDSESDQVVGFHWVNIGAHGINAILAYFLMLKLLRRSWAALFAAGMFAVHPIATESVTNIIGRADEFGTMSFLACTLLYIRSTETQGLRRVPWLVAVMLFFVAGCFSKESALAFLAMPLAFDAVYRWGSEAYRERRARKILFDWLCYLALTIPLIFVLVVRSFVFRDAPKYRFPFVDNPILRLDWSASSSLSVNINNWILGRMTAFNVAAKGLWKLVWPLHLSSDYSYNQIPLFEWQLSDIENIKAILSALMIAATLAVAVRCYKRYKAVSFLILFYWITYGPTSNFLVSGSSIMAERFFYLPSIAFCGLAVLGIDSLAHRIGSTVEFTREKIRKPWPGLVPQAVLLSILVLYGARAYGRNFDWRSDVTLAQSAMKESPHSFRSYGKLAESYYQMAPTDNVDRLIELGEKGLTIIDDLPDAENGTASYITLGIYYGLKGERVSTRTADGLLLMNDQTRRWYEKSARVLERGSEIDRASNEDYRASELKRGRPNMPDTGQPDLYLYLGMAYERLALDEKALETFRYLRHLDPLDARSYVKIATTQLVLERVEDAAVSLLQCLIVDPKRRDPWPLLIQIYQQANHEPIPAIQIAEGRPQLLEDNKLVRKHLFLAYTGIMKIFQFSERPDLLGPTRDVAINHYHFDAKLLENALNEKVARPVPASPVFHAHGKKLVE